MTPVRQGISKNLTLEAEAVAILEAMALGKRAQGKLLSQLLRAEEARRYELARLRTKLLADVDGALQAPEEEEARGA
jgi:hypothetical protein